MTITQTPIVSLNQLLTFLVAAQQSVDDDPTICVTKTDDGYNLVTEHVTAQLDIDNVEDVLWNLEALPECLEDEEFGYGLWDIMLNFEVEYPHVQPTLPFTIVDAMADWMKMRSGAFLIFKQNNGINQVILDNQSSFFIPKTMSTWFNNNFLKFNTSYNCDILLGLTRSYKISALLS